MDSPPQPTFPETNPFMMTSPRGPDADAADVEDGSVNSADVDAAVYDAGATSVQLFFVVVLDVTVTLRPGSEYPPQTKIFSKSSTFSLSRLTMLGRLSKTWRLTQILDM